MSTKRDLFQKRGEITVAGLDLSLTNAGVAILSKNKNFFYSFGYSLEADASAREQIERILTITTGIMGVLKEHNVRYVGVENYAFSRAANRITMQAELGGVVKSQIYSVLKTCVIPLPVTTVRKFVLGKSTKQKAPLQKYLKSIGFTQPSNPDEFDALAVALVVDVWANKRSLANSDDDFLLIDKMDYSISKKVSKKMLPL